MSRVLVIGLIACIICPAAVAVVTRQSLTTDGDYTGATTQETFAPTAATESTGSTTDADSVESTTLDEGSTTEADSVESTTPVEDATTGADSVESTTPDEDRNGGYTDWGAWDSCSATCGSSGMQTRERNCTNPTPEGAGALCSGSAFDTGSCNQLLCPDQLSYGITVKIQNLSLSNYLNASTSIKLAVVNVINSYCNYDQTTAQECCQMSLTFVNITGLNLLPDSSFIAIEPYVASDGIKLVIVITSDDSNELCAAGTNTTVGRRRRAIINLPQSSLVSVLGDTAIWSAIEIAIFNATGVVVIIEWVEASTQITTTVASVSTAGVTASTTVSTATGVKAWVIAVAVVAALVVVTIIIVAVVIVLKRPKRVGTTDDGAAAN